MKTTPEEFATKMRDIPKNLDSHGLPWDAEVSHRLADDYMCNLLRELGYEEGVYIFERETAKRMLHQMDISEVLVVDGSYLVAREYKDLTKPNHYKQATEHVLFYDFLKSQDHFTFGLG